MKRKILQSVLLPLFLLALSFQAFSETMETETSLTGQEDRLPLTYEKTLSQGKYMGGGVASILLGWGIGHAIQGRYAEKGWVFTAGGVLLVGGAIGYVASSDPFEPSADPFEPSATSYLSLGAMLIGSGLRIWELIDAWMLPSHYKVVKESPFEIKPLAFYDPSTNFNYGLSFKYKF